MAGTENARHNAFGAARAIRQGGPAVRYEQGAAHEVDPRFRWQRLWSGGYCYWERRFKVGRDRTSYLVVVSRADDGSWCVEPWIGAEQYFPTVREAKRSARRALIAALAAEALKRPS